MKPVLVVLSSQVPEEKSCFVFVLILCLCLCRSCEPGLSEPAPIRRAGLFHVNARGNPALLLGLALPRAGARGLAILHINTPFVEHFKIHAVCLFPDASNLIKLFLFRQRQNVFCWDNISAGSPFFYINRCQT